ncbi:MAG: hypothetical protein OEW21_12540 [Betaproteobacteria bacterium]|nr:hypothetical protein [Betaproteobacteria bacterium]
MDADKPLRLNTLLGDYPNTAALRRGELRSPGLALDFADVKTPSSAFKRTVRELEFDVSELALVTFLMAKAWGKPLVLLPAVLFSRFQHPYLVYNAERGRLAPRDLEGRRIGIRSYSVTTVAWLRAVLADDYGVDLERVRWVSFEEPHVAEFRDPPSVERAAAGQDAATMLLAGEIDAAILAPPPKDARLQPVIADPESAARAWYRRTQAVQINHMVVVRESLTRSHPETVRELWRLLVESRRRGGSTLEDGIDARPYGLDAIRRPLEVAIECVVRQGLVPRRLGVDELFDEVTRSFAV